MARPGEVRKDVLASTWNTRVQTPMPSPSHDTQIKGVSMVATRWWRAARPLDDNPANPAYRYSTGYCLARPLASWRLAGPFGPNRPQLTGESGSPSIWM